MPITLVDIRPLEDAPGGVRLDWETPIGQISLIADPSGRSVTIETRSEFGTCKVYREGATLMSVTELGTGVAVDVDFVTDETVGSLHVEMNDPVSISETSLFT
ncbi:hypothetical protein [Gordonia sesuvii]